MPKIEIDYSNTIIYKIICKDPLIKEVYVGHTTNFVQRKHAHKQSCNNIKSPCYNLKLYTTIRANGNWSNWDMTIINFFKCANHFEARQKEQEYFIALNATLNSVEPLSSKNKLFFNIQLDEQPKPTETIISNAIPKFYCKNCNYGSSKKSSFDSHLLSAKHHNPINDKFDFSCILCSKNYKDNSGLWRHNNKMHNLKNTNDKKKEEETEFKKITELFTNIVKQHQDIFIVVKQNQELQKTLLDFSSKILGKNL
jgi:hypothetical protein